MKSPGLLVRTKSGQSGRTFHSKGKINGKVPVYIEGQDKPLLCDPEGLKVTGFID